MRYGRGWNRTSDFLRVKQALWPAELLAHEAVATASDRPVAEPNLFGESSDALGREHNNQQVAHGGEWFPP